LLGESVDCPVKRGLHIAVRRIDVRVVAGAFWVVVELSRIEQQLDARGGSRLT
jgi:hypothetical protein